MINAAAASYAAFFRLPDAHDIAPPSFSHQS
jgi:hypothetical protein